jgi:integrase/recombinase XerD
MEALEAFRAALAAQDLSTKSIDSYSRAVCRFVSWYEEWTGSAFAPGEIATPAITRFRQCRAEEGKSPNTINLELIGLKRFFAWALSAGLIDTDPSAPVMLVEQVIPPPRPLTEQEEARLLATVNRYGSLRDRVLIPFALHTGLRTMELCNLKVKDVTLRPRSGVVRVRAGKGNKYRDVPLNATARESIVLWMESQALEEWLFPSHKTKGRIGERALRHMLHPYVKVLNLEGITMHSLRDTFAYRLKTAGVPIEEIADLLGQADMNTTRRRYARATGDDLQRTVEKIAWR